MALRKNTSPPPQLEPEPPPPPAVDPEVMEILQRLEKSGVQLLIRVGAPEEYTSEVVGLGVDAFFIDTMSPPVGDARVRTGTRVEVETLFQGITYTFEAQVLGKVQFVDELPAYRVAYPTGILSERRRKTPRVETAGDASLSFLRPFACDATVVNLSEGGLAFDYAAELGRLRRGTVVREVLLELGGRGVISIQGRVVGNLVAELGGLSLPRRFRASLAFQGLNKDDLAKIKGYLSDLRAWDVTA